MSDRERVRVCPAADLPPGERTTLSVDGVPVGVFNVEGTYYALENRCRHQGGPVCAGTVQPTLTAEFSEPGRRVEESFGDRFAVACPWHGYEYDLATGDHVGDSDVSLPTYDVVVEDGVVFLEP